MDMNMGDVDEQADEVYEGILGEIGLDYSESNPVCHFVLLILYVYRT